MKTDKLEYINNLKQEISNINSFIDLVCRDYECGNYSFGFFNKMFLKKKFKITNISILGKYFFGIGEHVKEINIPQSLLLKIEKMAYELKKQKEEEFNSLINNK